MGSGRRVLLVAAVVVLAAMFVGIRLEMGPGSIATGRATGSVALATARPIASGPRDDALPTIARSALPREARSTLALIAAGGPFPYDQDGAIYQNRERLLPLRPPGSYHEYTVETPGSPDRGARRIVMASTGEAYWTADHYASFARILP